MYYCYNCRLRFSAPQQAYTEPRTHFGYLCRVPLDVCPCCGCDDFYEEGCHGT